VRHAETAARIAHVESVIPDVSRTPDEGCLATFWRQASIGTSYVRCAIPARWLPAQMIGFEMSDLKWTGDEETGHMVMPRQRGAAIWQFLGDDVRGRVALAQQEQGVRTLMEVDDNYLHSPGKWYPWAKTHEEAMASRGTTVGHSHEQHRHLAGLVDGIIVTTEFLADRYADFNDNVYVCPNSVDPNDWDWERPEPDGILRIGFAGAPTHIFDYALVKKALKWAQRQDGVEVYLMGFHANGFTGTHMDWTDSISEYQHQLGILDVGLCPVVSQNWIKGKSDLKALEYAMAGVLPVVSRTIPYKPWLDRDYPYVAQTEEDWMRVVQDLVRNRDKIAGAAAEAKEYVENERVIYKSIDRWREAINA